MVTFDRTPAWRGYRNASACRPGRGPDLTGPRPKTKAPGDANGRGRAGPKGAWAYDPAYQHGQQKRKAKGGQTRNQSGSTSNHSGKGNGPGADRPEYAEGRNCVELTGGTTGARCGRMENRPAARDGGRRLAIEPRSDYTIEGGSAGAEALRFLEGRPGAFRYMPRGGSDAGGVFPSVMGRFGGAVRAAKTNA